MSNFPFKYFFKKPDIKFYSTREFSAMFVGSFIGSLIINVQIGKGVYKKAGTIFL